ncbi:AfsR/SARP family transcriptional regulator [Actinokineospora globicatena]|uniref:Bacterial transcriptional activator domain-containing protein n=1 Tax=Actinokineospora globicatena TaxID=103729 RepID=A0A9W6QNW5_9PSEU|nr:tetratricopeptide repeat protein [Actinokineospora globicatena]GLW93225.1 hypothetical protein Aglo03_40410 [Actinokineospora globicatena]
MTLPQTAVEIRLLGDIEIAGPAGRDTLSHLGARRLLVALAIDAGRPVGKSILVNRLWQEAEQSDNALDTTSRYVRYVRSALREVGGSGWEVHNDRRTGTYALRCPPGQVDYQRFHAEMVSARERADPALMESALALWRGPALTGVSGTWFDLPRKRMHGERRAALRDLLTVWMREGRYPEVMSTLDTVDQQIGLDDQLLLLGVEALERSGQHVDVDLWLGQAIQRMRELAESEPTSETFARLGDLTAVRPIFRQPRPAGQASSAMFTMRRDIPEFTGRQKELGELVAAVENMATNGAGATMVYSVDGMAGVGKTVFVTHVAHQVAHRFPDGSLFIELHGHSPGQSPLRLADALQVLLLDTGLSLDDIPPHLDERTRLWRARIAGKRILLVLDDVTTYDQVRPLVPTTPGSLVLITSRNRLLDLGGTVPLTIPSMPTADAVRMLARLAQRSHSAEQEGLQHLVQLCGHLPLAIAIVAAQLRSHAKWTAEDISAKLGEGYRQLIDLHAGDQSVRLAFDTSYRDLSTSQQDLVRYLGLHPGSDIEEHAAAEMVQSSLDQVRSDLETLHSRHLIEEREGRRYRFHDLLRWYAQLKADALTKPVQQGAVDRLLRFYVFNTYKAGMHMPTRHTPADQSTPTPSRYTYPVANAVQAQRWLREELPNLSAVVENSSGHAGIVQLSTYLHPFLRSYGYWGHAQVIHRAAIAAAAAAGNDLGRAGALVDLAKIERFVGDYTGSAGNLTEAESLYRACEVPQGRANALNSLGVVQCQIGDYRLAASCFTGALQLFVDLNDNLGRANALSGLGIVDLLKGWYGSAAGRFSQARALYLELGDRLGVANMLRQLGSTHLELGELATAAELFDASLRLFVELDDQVGRADVLHDLGAVLVARGEYSAARHTLGEALDVYATHNAPVGRGNIYLRLGLAHHGEGDLDQAADSLAEALRHYAGAGYHLGTMWVRLALGDLALDQGSSKEHARDHLDFALALSQRIDSEINQAHALLGLARLVEDEPDSDAVRMADEALTIYRKLGSPRSTVAAALVSRLRSNFVAGTPVDRGQNRPHR